MERGGGRDSDEMKNTRHSVAVYQGLSILEALSSILEIH